MAHDEHVKLPADKRLGKAVHDLRLDLHAQLCAALRLLGRTSVGHNGGGRSLLGGVGKYAGAFDFRLAEEFAQLFKFRLALAGKPCDERCAQHKPRNALAQLLEERADLFARAAAVHAAKDGVVDVLDRDIKILDDLILRCDLVDEFVVDELGVEIVQTHPAEIKFT